MTVPTVPPSAVHLQVATNILDGTLRSAGINQARAACWVTRRGLEELVSELLCHRSVAVGRGSMRSKLICLSVTYADQPENVAAILMAWDQLSRACHHHAYELTPTSAEARHLIETLRAVT